MVHRHGHPGDWDRRISLPILVALLAAAIVALNWACRWIMQVLVAALEWIEKYCPEVAGG